MKPLFLVFLLSLVIKARSFSQSSSCDCPANLFELRTETETNYAGFGAKASGGKNQSYAKLLEELSRKAVLASSNSDCYKVLAQYVRFFRDKHFMITLQRYEDRDIATEPLVTRENSLTLGFTGEWINADSTLAISARKTINGNYQAIVKWARDSSNYPTGMVYSTFVKKGDGWISRRYDWFTSTDIPVRVDGNLLKEWNLEVFGRSGYMSAEERTELTTWRAHQSGLSFSLPDRNTSMLRIPSFNDDSKIQQLVAANDSAIRSRPYLIIDLRGNGGGNTGWVHFLPYIMTGPITQPKSELRISRRNVERALSDLETFVKNPVPDEYKKYFPDSVMAIYRKAYAELPVTKKEFYPMPSVFFPFDSASRFPEKVALVFDEACGSSTEYFFEISKQSKKVTRFGSHTLGMMDYVGMNHATPLPFADFYVSMPMARSGWTATRPIDHTGFVPEVRLNARPRETWIRFIQSWMGNGK